MQAPRAQTVVVATFTDHGAIGLRFVANEDATYAVETLTVADDVQRRHPDLGPGLCLTHVSGEDVAGLGYTTVLQLLKRAGRGATQAQGCEARPKHECRAALHI